MRKQGNLKDLDFQYQRRIERFKAEGATQKAILTQQMNDAKSQVMNVQRQYNDYIDKLAQDGVKKYSDEQQQHTLSTPSNRLRVVIFAGLRRRTRSVKNPGTF